MTPLSRTTGIEKTCARHCMLTSPCEKPLNEENDQRIENIILGQLRVRWLRKEVQVSYFRLFPPLTPLPKVRKQGNTKVVERVEEHSHIWRWKTNNKSRNEERKERTSKLASRWRWLWTINIANHGEERTKSWRERVSLEMSDYDNGDFKGIRRIQDHKHEGVLYQCRPKRPHKEKG